MNRSGVVVVLVGMCALSSAGIASAQPRVSVGQLEGKHSSTVRGAAVRALQKEDSVMLISKDAVAGTARRLGVTMPKGRKEISAALGIGAWVEGSVEREGKTYVTNLAVIDSASGKTLGVMSYDGPSTKSLVKTIRAELWTDLGELIRSGKVPNGKKGAEPPKEVAAVTAADESADALAEEEEAEELEEEEAEPAPAVASEQDDDRVEETLADDTAPASDDNDTQSEEEPAGQSGEGGAVPFVLGVGLAGFSRDFVYNDNVSDLPLYDLGLGPSLLINANWYPAAHFSSGAAANIGLDLRGQIAFGLDSEVQDNTSFPTSSGGFGIGVRGRVPLGSHELAAVVGYGRRTYSIGQVDSDDATGMHPYVPSTAYSFMRLGVDAHFALTQKFGVGLSLAFLPTFSTGTEEWFENATANGIEGEVKVGYSLSRSLEVNAAFALQRFGLSFNPTIEDAMAGKPIAGGAVDQYLSLALGMGWRFGQ
jgi:hypothetical protein